MFTFKQLIVIVLHELRVIPNNYYCFQSSSEEDEMPENSSQQHGPFGDGDTRLPNFIRYHMLPPVNFEMSKEEFLEMFCLTEENNHFPEISTSFLAVN